MGRPKQSKNKPLEHAEGELTRCPKCQSTNRNPYTSRVEQAFEGHTSDGKPFTHIIRRRTSCADCGQHRIDRHLEYRQPEKRGTK